MTKVRMCSYCICLKPFHTHTFFNQNVAQRRSFFYQGSLITDDQFSHNSKSSNIKVYIFGILNKCAKFITKIQIDLWQLLQKAPINVRKQLIPVPQVNMETCLIPVPQVNMET